MRHRTMLEELGKLWGHLADGYGLCILQYTKLLINKLNFHDHNPKFPGSLLLKRGELEQIALNDINMYFQLAIEMFDYLDEIIALQATIFNSITTFAVSSMTSAGQCRLLPLIPCIQDSNQLYDFVVRLMFLLHANLQEDLLVHHRERFRTIFRQLNSFYKQSGQLQYFVNLITVPVLPKNPPNFLQQSDLGNYTAPRLKIMAEDTVSESDSNSVVDNLIDTNVEESQTMETSARVEETPAPSMNYERMIKDREDIIVQLQQENENQRSMFRKTLNEKQEREHYTQEQLSKLTSELAELQNEVVNLRLQNKELELKMETAPNLEQKVQLEEEKSKMTEEKFQKLKNMYTQIRDEHINLLRKHGETNKALQENQKEFSDLANKNEELNAKILEFEMEKSKINDMHQKSSSENTQKLVEFEKRVLELEQENKNLLDQFQNVESNKSAQIAELQIKLEELESFKEKLSIISNEKSELEKHFKENEQTITHDYEERIDTLEKEKTNLVDKLEDLDKNKSAQIIELNEKLTELQSKYDDVVQNVAKLEAEKKDMVEVHTETIKKAEENFKEMQSTLVNEKSNLENLSKAKEQELLEEIEKRTTELQTQFDANVTQLKIQNSAAQSALMKILIKGFEELSLRSIQEGETPGTQTSSAYFIILSDELQDLLTKLTMIYKTYSNDKDLNAEGYARNLISSGHLLSLIYDRGMAICNTLTNINSGEKIASQIKEYGNSIIELFNLLLNDSDVESVKTKVADLKNKLYSITNMVGDISSNKDELDKLEDMVEKELNSMDRAVEEAAKKIAEMLSQSRASDNGIKLEVNEKILESCTNLMRCIKVLVQKSRKVQNEIIASGKGSLSTREFYKRNHQWTEGLISAGKSVAASAKLLVDAANKAVTEQSNHMFDVIVAAQEIAACVAVLVVSSRVKASRDSQNLSELTKVSKEVTECVGAVVATSKNCSQQLEENQEFDFTKLSIHQAKTKEMEIQVKVLELDQSLQMERRKLASLRRQNYQSE